jgi:hypothetical protein
MLSWNEHKAVFWLNATYRLLNRWTADTFLHKWARRKLKEATRELIPIALSSFKEAYPNLASDPHVRYTFYPAIDPKTGYADVMCIGEVGLSKEGASAQTKAVSGFTDCFFHADAEGNLK